MLRSVSLVLVGIGFVLVEHFRSEEGRGHLQRKVGVRLEVVGQAGWIACHLDDPVGPDVECSELRIAFARRIDPLAVALDDLCARDGRQRDLPTVDEAADAGLNAAVVREAGGSFLEPSRVIPAAETAWSIAGEIEEDHESHAGQQRVFVEILAVDGNGGHASAGALVGDVDDGDDVLHVPVRVEPAVGLAFVDVVKIEGVNEFLAEFGGDGIGGGPLAPDNELLAALQDRVLVEWRRQVDAVAASANGRVLDEPALVDADEAVVEVLAIGFFQSASRCEYGVDEDMWQGGVDD